MIKSGTSGPVTRLISAALRAMFEVSKSAKPIRSGVPTAPKVTAVELATKATAMEQRRGKPIESSSGATIAAGVPKPALPSINDPKSQATSTAWMRRSGDKRCM